jgi:hypothetical protein
MLPTSLVGFHNNAHRYMRRSAKKRPQMSESLTSEEHSRGMESLNIAQKFREDIMTYTQVCALAVVFYFKLHQSCNV